VISRQSWIFLPVSFHGSAPGNRTAGPSLIHSWVHRHSAGWPGQAFAAFVTGFTRALYQSATPFFRRGETRRVSCGFRWIGGWSEVRTRHAFPRLIYSQVPVRSSIPPKGDGLHPSPVRSSSDRPPVYAGHRQTPQGVSSPTGLRRQEVTIPYVEVVVEIADSYRSRISKKNGGSGEIRTHERVAPSAVFKTAAFSRSATLPWNSSPWRRILQWVPAPRIRRPAATGPTLGVKPSRSPGKGFLSSIVQGRSSSIIGRIHRRGDGAKPDSRSSFRIGLRRFDSMSWYRGPGLNRGPPEPQSGALPTELRRHAGRILSSRLVFRFGCPGWFRTTDLTLIKRALYH
jgi:hypothetical protein